MSPRAQRQPPAGAGGAGWVFGVTALALLCVLALAAGLPDPVVSHFDLRGRPDGTMPLARYTLLSCACVATVPSPVWWLLRRHAAPLAAPIAVALALFFCAVFWLTADAARSATPLDMRAILGTVAALLAFIGAAVARWQRRAA